MYDALWTDDAVRLMRLARDESRTFGDDYVGTQHLLLAASEVAPLKSWHFNRQELLEAIRQTLGFRDSDSVLISPGAQTPRSKLAIERAMVRAAGASRAVTPEDLWYGLLSDPESESSRVLDQLGTTAARLLASVGAESQST